MNEMKRFGECVRYLLQKKGMTAEELVFAMNSTECVKTNKAALSRIMTGKRIPNDEEAQVMANVLNAPILLEIYESLKKYISTQDGVYALDFYEKTNFLLDANDGSKEDIPHVDYNLLFQILKGLYRYCLNHDVTKRIEKEFGRKLTQIKGHGKIIKRLQLMYQCLNHTKLTKQAHAWIEAALLYFITPIDLIPDFLLPYGYIDDAIVVGFIFHKLGSTFNHLLSEE
jgi:uncharacterized membrane protein YkvA (DUF1232 family)